MTDTPLHTQISQRFKAKPADIISGRSSAQRATESLDLASLRVPKGRFTDAIEYWSALVKKDQIPMASAFDLLSLPQLVANITLFEIAGDRIRIRFVGTEIVQEIGEDTTGKFLDDMPNMGAVQDRAFGCTRTRQAYFHDNLPVTWTSKDYVTYSTLGLPLAGQDGKIVQIAFLMIFN